MTEKPHIRDFLTRMSETLDGLGLAGDLVDIPDPVELLDRVALDGTAETSRARTASLVAWLQSGETEQAEALRAASKRWSEESDLQPLDEAQIPQLARAARGVGLNIKSFTPDEVRKIPPAEREFVADWEANVGTWTGSPDSLPAVNLSRVVWDAVANQAGFVRGVAELLADRLREDFRRGMLDVPGFYCHLIQPGQMSMTPLHPVPDSQPGPVSAKIANARDPLAVGFAPDPLIAQDAELYQQVCSVAARLECYAMRQPEAAREIRQDLEQGLRNDEAWFRVYTEFLGRSD